MSPSRTDCNGIARRAACRRNDDASTMPSCRLKSSRLFPGCSRLRSGNEHDVLLHLILNPSPFASGFGSSATRRATFSSTILQMAFSYRRLFFGGNTFCCCLPVRLGMIVLTILTCLIAGLLSVIIWFEVSSTKWMWPAERAAFVLAGLSETILFVASILGLVGTIVRKQNFTQIYAYTLYTHFFLNIIVIAYFTYEIARASSNTEKVACLAAIKDPQAQQQCTDLLSFARWVYVTIAGTILFLEMYGSIIVARYVNQLQREKREARAFRSDMDQAFQLKARDGHNYSKLPDPESQVMLPILDPSYLGPSHIEFDPYAEERPAHEPTQSSPSYENTAYDGVPPPIEEGYGGGTWTHDEIAQEEKAKLKLRDQEEEGRSIIHIADHHSTRDDSSHPIPTV